MSVFVADIYISGEVLFVENYDDNRWEILFKHNGVNMVAKMMGDYNDIIKTGNRLAMKGKIRRNVRKENGEWIDEGLYIYADPGMVVACNSDVNINEVYLTGGVVYAKRNSPAVHTYIVKIIDAYEVRGVSRKSTSSVICSYFSPDEPLKALRGDRVEIDGTVKAMRKDWGVEISSILSL